VKLTATVSPSNASNKNVAWSSGNAKIAAVSGSGVVTGIAAGVVKVTVKTADGGKTATASVTVKMAASTLTISGQMKVPNPLAKGKAVSVKGKVSSNYKLTKVAAVIRTTSGTAKYSMSANPNAKSFDLHAWDSKLLFSKLAAGSYRYIVTASDASGTSKILQSTPFTVKNPTTPTPSKPAPALPADGSCPSGSQIIPKITEGWFNGKKTKITLCEIKDTTRLTIRDDREFSKSIYKGLAANKVDAIALTPAAAAAFVAMQKRAKNNKVTLDATFSYRSYNEQKAIYYYRALDNRGNLTGKRLVGGYVVPAKPGYSNHQSGLSLDLTASSLKWAKACIKGGTSYDKANDGRCFGFYDDVGSSDPKHFTHKPKASSAPAPPKVATSLQKTLNNIDKSKNIPVAKKEPAKALAKVMLEKKYDLAFVAGMLANVCHEGEAGKFESSAYKSKPEPSYLLMMDTYYGYRNKYSGQYVFNKDLTAVDKMVTTLNVNGWKIKTSGKDNGKRAGFGLGSVQWTWKRAYTLVQMYKEANGGKAKIGKDQTIQAEAKMVTTELLSKQYKSIYESWKSNNVKALATQAAAYNAGYKLSLNYEVPAGGRKSAEQRGSLAKKIYVDMAK
jgi:hypothetical protein